MHIKKIHLEYARPYGLCQIEPINGLNVLFGSNGMGKTTVLESIYIALTGKSFKSHRLKEFIQNKQDYSKIKVQLNDEASREVVIKARSKQLHKNGSPIRALSEFCQGMACVALIPEHVALIKGSAEHRRKYLDHMLFFKDPGFAKEMAQYKKALSQKQSLLKAKLPFAAYQDQVAPWDQQLLSLSERIRELRQALVTQLQPRIKNFYQKISQGHTDLDISYDRHEDDMQAELEEKRKAEHLMQRCLLGCHKDDVKLSINGFDFAANASQGERASCLLAMKFSELESLQSACEHIILLLDDIGGTLDQDRRKILIEWLSDQTYQTFISTADMHIRDAGHAIGGKVFAMENIHAEGLDKDLRVCKWNSV